MAHQQQLDFVRLASTTLPQFFYNKKVLEIGSLYICGSVRSYFRDCNYTGLDVAPGRGVDLVCEGQSYTAPDAEYDHIISCEAMEHNPAWKETFLNMTRLTKPGGLITLTCASYGRAEHGTTRTSPEASPLTVGKGWEYYRNLGPRDFYKSFPIDKIFSEHCFWSNWVSKDLYFLGIRKGVEVAAGKSLLGDARFEVNKYVDETNNRLAYKMLGVASRLAGEDGANLVLNTNLNQILWKSESAYYQLLGQIKRVLHLDGRRR